MYRKKQPNKTSITKNTSYQGESLEQKIQRIFLNKEPITDGAPLVYTDRKEGVKPEYDIRTDRWEIANEAMDKVSKSWKAKRENRIAEEAKKGMETEAKNEQSSANTSDSNK